MVKQLIADFAWAKPANVKIRIINKGMIRIRNEKGGHLAAFEIRLSIYQQRPRFLVLESFPFRCKSIVRIIG